MSLKLPTVRVRARVVAGGAVLGGALLVGMALVGGVDGTPRGERDPGPDRLGPATAIQPELREALLTDQDLPPAPADGRGAAPPAEPPAGPDGEAKRSPSALVPAEPETGALSDLCRALFEDPAGLAGLWQATPEEVTSGRSRTPDGATVHQVLGVFEAERSVEAYRRLRESASGCNRFEATLADGAPVTVLLRELTAPRPESTPADDSYTMVITLEDGARAGWLTIDRVGRVVSVLRYLGPTDADDDVTQTRHAALNKLQPLLQTLSEGAG